MRMKNLVLATSLFVWSGLSISCRDKSVDPAQGAIARVGDSYLYRTDLQKDLPSGLSAQDSAAYTEQYINNWIMRKVIYRKAQMNVDDGMNGIEKKVEDFREDLYIHTYEELLVDSKMGSDKIPDEEIAKYYESHKNDFILDENVIRADYVQLPKSLGENDKLLMWLKSDSEDDNEKLKDYSYQFADKFYFGATSWISANDLMRELPIKNPYLEFFKNNKYYTGQDSTYFYMVHIYEFMSENQQAPLSYSEKAIKRVLLQKKRHDMIKSVRNKLYEDALHKNVFEIY